MARLRPVLLAFGLIAALMGMLWIGQGLGYVRWPASSFMIDDREWVTRGAILAVGGLLIVLAMRRYGRR